MKNKIIGIFVCMLLIITTASVSGSIHFNENKLEKQSKVTEGLDVDWWPMYRHDPQHSGYTSSPGPVTNNILWKFDTGKFVYSDPAIVNDKVYVGSFNKKLHCLDALTGEPIWEYETGGWVVSSPCVYEDKVIFNSRDGMLYCVDAEDGSEIWTLPGSVSAGRSPTVVDGKVFIGSNTIRRNKGIIYCLDVEDGNILWSVNTRESEFSSPAYIDGRVYIGSARQRWSFTPAPHFIYCLDADTGEIQWKQITGFNGLELPPQISLSKDKVYFGVSGLIGGKVGCLDAQTGDYIWRYYTYIVWNEIVSIGPPAIAYDKIYFKVHDYFEEINEVRCLDADSGKHLWTFEGGAGIPTISDGKVYFGSWEGNVVMPKGTIYCLDAENAEIIWQYTPFQNIASSPSIVNGRMYIGTNTNNVFCFGE